jgi:hypothetical protein
MLKPISLAFASSSLFLALLFSFIFTSCHSKAAPTNGNFPPMIAASDDTIHNYAIGIFQHHRFAYTITYGNQLPDATREFYHGTWQYRSDTLFLHYHKKRPPGMTDYLVKEITGGWLIQFFTDGRPRVFLRVPRRRIR